MIWVLKVVLSIILAGVVLCFRFFFLDWKSTKASEAYSDITPFEKMRFNTVFMIVFMSLVSLGVFLLYFILSTITAEFELW